MSGYRFLLANYTNEDLLVAEVDIAETLIRRLLEAYVYVGQSDNAVLVRTMANVFEPGDAHGFENIEPCAPPAVTKDVVEFEVASRAWRVVYYDAEGRQYASAEFRPDEIGIRL
ncbi:MAG: hypothetical protein N3A60_00160 [Thermanaerothrix sp.]|jgi:hypothetical protein|nr:hypothetical protein [Thermanaerothrix sp.]